MPVHPKHMAQEAKMVYLSTGTNYINRASGINARQTALGVFFSPMIVRRIGIIIGGQVETSDLGFSFGTRADSDLYFADATVLVGTLGLSLPILNGSFHLYVPSTEIILPANVEVISEITASANAGALSLTFALEPQTVIPSKV